MARRGRDACDPHTALQMPGMYVSGWLARGPVGVIASTMYDANSVADLLLADWAAQSERSPAAKGMLADVPEPLAGLPAELRAPTRPVVSWQGWERLDREELRRGKELGKLREKVLCACCGCEPCLQLLTRPRPQPSRRCCRSQRRAHARCCACCALHAARAACAASALLLLPPCNVHLSPQTCPATRRLWSAAPHCELPLASLAALLLRSPAVEASARQRSALSPPRQRLYLCWSCALQERSAAACAALPC